MAPLVPQSKNRSQLLRIPLSLIVIGVTCLTFGAYTLEAHGAQSSKDHLAEKALGEAEELRRRWQLEAFQQSLKKYDEARLLWQASANSARVAHTYKGSGEVFLVMGEYRKALQAYSSSLRIYRTLGDSKGEAEILNSIASVYLYLGENQTALKHSNSALLLSQKIGDRLLQTQSLNNLADCYYSLGDFKKATQLLDEQRAIGELESNKREHARALNIHAWIYVDQGQSHKALDCLNHALALWRDVNDRQGEAVTLSALGTQYSYIGEFQQALDVENEALSIFQAIGDRKGEADALSKLGYMYFGVGELERSISYYNRAAALYRQLANRYLEGTLVANIGDALALLGNTRGALANYENGLRLVRLAGDKQWEAFILHSMGVALSLEGKTAPALNAFNQALVLFHGLGNVRWEANTLNGIATTYIEANDFSKAFEPLTLALKLSRAADDLSGESFALFNLARVESHQGNLEKATTQIAAVLKIHETLRSRILSYQSRASYVAYVHQYYELYTDLLMRQHAQNPSAGFDARAFEAMERGRARSLMEMIIEGRAQVRKDVDPQLLERERLLEARLTQQMRQQILRVTGNDKRSPHSGDAQEDLEALTAEYQQVQAKIRSASPRQAVRQPEPITTTAAQRLLDADTLLLEYSLGDKRSFLWVIGQQFIKTYELPSRTQIEELARKLHVSLAARSVNDSSSQPSEALSEILLGKLGSLLGEKRLVIVVDGALQYVPFGLLPEPASSRGNVKPLIAKHDIAYLPSASVLAVQRREFASRVAAPYAVAIFADPVFESRDPRVLARQGSVAKAARVSSRANSHASLVSRALRDVGLGFGKTGIPRLPFSRQEAIAINKVSEGTESLQALDFTANRQTLTKTDLSKYRIIHFATHGLLNSDHPELSGILLSMVDERGKPQDGFLQLHEIYNLNLRAELVVLSACQTALGKDIKGEGLIGLTRGFMYAGAERVVASLWKVDDAATAELMSHFYQEMFLNKKKPAAALRAAQLKVASHPSWQSPYYWAGFVLQGEWN